MRRSRLLSALFFGVAVTGVFFHVIACTEPPPPTYLLDRPRILAIRAEPPALVPDGQVTLDALVYVPPGSPAPEYDWSWCASLGDTQQCATTAEALATILDGVSVDAGEDGGGDVPRPIGVTYAIGTGAAVPFAYPVPAAVADALCERSRPDVDADAGDDAGIDAGTLSGLFCREDSWTAYVMLTVKVGDRTLQATRELAAFFTAPASINTNPNVLGLSPYTSPLPELPPLDGGTDEYAVADATVGGSTSGAVLIAAAVPESASELYGSGRGITRGPTRRYERLTIAWYAERGTLASGTTTLESGREDIAARDWTSLLANHWTPKGAGPTEIALVVRDDRGGIGWVRQRTP